MLAALPAGQSWSRLYDITNSTTKYLSQNELPYASNLTMYLYDDELSDVQLSDPARLGDMAATYADWRLRYPNAMVGSNFTGTMPNDANLANYMQVTQPDLLMFDDYVGDYDYRAEERNRLYTGSAYTSLPDNVSRWGRSDTNGDNLKWLNSHTADTGGYTDYITGIAPTVTQGGAIDTTYGDILIGYLKPLLADNSGCTFADGLHFMIVNGSVGPGTSGAVAVDANGVIDTPALAAGTADALAQWYRLTFDFTGSDFDSLVRLSRDTGKVELVTLTPMGNSTCALDLYLPGGTGDLFTFWDRSNPLPSVPEPGALVLLATGLTGIMTYAWRKRT